MLRSKPIILRSIASECNFHAILYAIFKYAIQISTLHFFAMEKRFFNYCVIIIEMVFCAFLFKILFHLQKQKRQIHLKNLNKLLIIKFCIHRWLKKHT